MSSFQCQRCHQKFTRAYNLKRHEERKNPCKPVDKKKETIYHNLPQFTTINHNLPQFTTIENPKNNKIPKKDKTSDKVECKWCNKKVHKKALARHYRTACIMIPKKNQNSLINKYNNHKRHTTALAIPDNNPNTSVNSGNNPGTTNITNNNTMNNSNNTTINNVTIENKVTLKINPLGQEDLSFLTKDDKLKILERMYNGVPELIKKIHSHPENRNLFLPNVNKNVVAYLNKDNELQYDKKDDVCQQIIDDNIDRLDDIFNEFKSDIKHTMKDRIEKIVDKNQTNTNHDKYFNEVNMFLLNISKQNRKDLNKYLDKLDEELVD
jgi:hypothetical protein